MPKKKPPEPILPSVCIQQIGTRWTKASRGGAGAVARNRVPKSLPFAPPVPALKDASRLLQVISFGEGYPADASKSFRSKRERDLQVTAVAEPYSFKGVFVCLADGLLHVEYEYTRTQGMPWRYSTTNRVACLEVGQWCQVLLNGRFSSYRYATGECDHWYQSEFINIGLFRRVETDIFLKTEPVKVYDRMAILF